jgi:hypothetical protein
MLQPEDGSLLWFKRIERVVQRDAPLAIDAATVRPQLWQIVTTQWACFAALLGTSEHVRLEIFRKHSGGPTTGVEGHVERLVA